MADQIVLWSGESMKWSENLWCLTVTSRSAYVCTYVYTMSGPYNVSTCMYMYMAMYRKWEWNQTWGMDNEKEMLLPAGSGLNDVWRERQKAMRTPQLICQASYQQGTRFCVSLSNLAIGGKISQHQVMNIIKHGKIHNYLNLPNGNGKWFPNLASKTILVCINWRHFIGGLNCYLRLVHKYEAKTNLLFNVIWLCIIHILWHKIWVLKFPFPFWLQKSYLQSIVPIYKRCPLNEWASLYI